MGISGVTLPADPIQPEPTTRRHGRLREPAAGSDPVRQRRRRATPGQPFPGFERSFSALAGARHQGDVLVPRRRRATAPTQAAQGRRRERSPGTRRPARRPTSPATPGGRRPLDRDARPTTGPRTPPGTAVSYVSPPLKSDTTVIGAGALEAWVRSSARRRPPGDGLRGPARRQGDLRAERLAERSARKLDPEKSTQLEPVLSLRKRDVAPLPKDRFAKVTIPLYYQGHAYRAGSRIRVTIAAPDGDQPIWAFAEAQPTGPRPRWRSPTRRDALAAAAAGGRRRQRPTGLPPCPGLRGEPCRDYVPFTNHESRCARAGRGVEGRRGAPPPH